MATKQISQLPSTNVSNDTDLVMTRQGSEDRAVNIQNVRNIGTESGESLGVGGYGIGGNAILITSLFPSDNCNLITRDGLYRITVSTANKPSGVGIGELLHIQTSDSEATQKVIGNNEKEYFRKKISGTWQSWILIGSANKADMRSDLSVPSNSEALLLANRLQEIKDAGTAAQAQTRDNLGAIPETVLFSGSTTTPQNLTTLNGGIWPGDGFYRITGSSAGAVEGVLWLEKGSRTQLMIDVVVSGSNLVFIFIQFDGNESVEVRRVNPSTGFSSVTLTEIVKLRV